MRVINTNDAKRWFVVQNGQSGDAGLQLFGRCIDNAVLDIPDAMTAETFLTEDELEVVVDDIATAEDYYKDAAESNAINFSMPSDKYPNQTL